MFTIKNPSEATGENNPALATAELVDAPAVTDAAPPQGNVVYIHNHGFTNGVYRVEPDGFERFLEFGNRSDRVREQQELNKRAIAETREQLGREKSAHAADSAVVVEKEKLAGNLLKLIGEREQAQLNLAQREAALIGQMQGTIAEYSWVPALLFLTAGVTFVAADISITKQITSWGFNMSGADAWIYAVGLAFTAFLIKPAFDRLLEKPFQAGGHRMKAVYKGVLLGITLLGLVMLYCLGKFRADSERAKIKLGDLRDQMAAVDPSSAPFKALQAEYEQVQQSLDENPMGQRGLVLSGLLFAIGGAVCLSVAFGSLKQLINRYWFLPWRIDRRRKELRVLGKRVENLRADHGEAKAEQEKAEGRLAANGLVDLQARLDSLYVEETGLVDEFYLVQYEKERALYQDGRSRGEKYALDGELIYKVVANDSGAVYVGKQNGSKESPLPSPLRPYTRRPFVKMRKMIADNFNKNQNNQTHDGTEFEIVS